MSVLPGGPLLSGQLPYGIRRGGRQRPQPGAGESDCEEPALLKETVNNRKDRWSRHGLGHLLNPTDPEASDRDWTAAVWKMIIRKGCGLKTTSPRFARLPAIGRTTVSSPFLMKSFETLNAGTTYAEQIKPFNFLLTAHVIPFGHPEGVDPESFHLITPYDSDPRKWLKKEWIGQHSKKRFRNHNARSLRDEADRSCKNLR